MGVEEMNKEYFLEIEKLLTPEERISIRQKLKNKSCTTCTNGSCRIETYEKVGADEFGNPQGYECIGWNNPEYIGRSKVLKLYDIHKLK